LNERLIHPMLRHEVGPEHLGEETTRITVFARRDQQNLGDG